MSLCSDFTSDEDDVVEEEELLVWPSHGAPGGRRAPFINFRPEVMIDKDNKKRRKIGEHGNLSFKFIRAGTYLIRTVLQSYGFKECREMSNDFNVMWLNSHVKPFSLRTMLEFQRVNHFPRSYEITRKDRLAKNVERMAQNKSAKMFDFIPRSFMMPSEYQDFCQHAARDKGPWIVKPIASSRGRGIYLVNNPSQVPLDDMTMVCRYIGNPLLVDGFKFDVRLYVAVTSYDPLIIYLYEEGMARFATIKYDTSSRHIKNQWMHLTNYSINKKNQDYVRCEDAEQEDYGNKWTLGALLRYLREEGVDTTVLMAKIEQVIIKSIIAVELPIGTACKMFMPHRGNCCELYGFDILIDDDLKPWVLEVNLSPSLATDAPIDLKIKSNVIADFFNIMGIEVTDPMSRRNKKDSRMHQNLPYSKNAQKSQNTNSSNNASQPAAGGPLGPDDQKLLRWVKDQYERRGGFVRIFPRAETWSAYGGLLELKTHTNELLAQRLFPDTYRPGSAVIRSRHLGKPLEEARFNQYERRLDALDKRRRRKKRRKGKTRRVAAADTKPLNEDQIEDETEQNVITAAGNTAKTAPIPPAEIPPPGASGDSEIPKNQKIQKKSVEKSDIYKSIRDAREKRKNGEKNDYISAEPPQKDDRLDISHVDETGSGTGSEVNEVVLAQIVKKLKMEAAKLCQVEAREAFATYLKRVQQRFLKEAALRSRADHRTEQMELVCRFLRRASANLQTPMDVKIPPPDSAVPLTERKRILASLLTEFIHRYNQETDELMTGNDVDITSGVVNRKSFEMFCKFGTEQDVEDVLTTYTHENKSASVFLGAKKSKNSAKSRKSNTNQIEPIEPPEKKPEEKPEVEERKTRKDTVPSGVSYSPYVKTGQNRSRSTSVERGKHQRSSSTDSNNNQKLLNRQIQDSNQISSAFENSVRGAAYIYSQRPRPPVNAPPNPPVVKKDVLVTNPLLPQKSNPQIASTTANEAIKLALKKLSERSLNGNADYNRVSQLAQQLAKLNQNAKKNSFSRPTSATVQRHHRYYSPKVPNNHNRSDGVARNASQGEISNSRSSSQTRQRPFSAHPTASTKSSKTTTTTRVCWK